MSGLSAYWLSEWRKYNDIGWLITTCFMLTKWLLFRIFIEVERLHGLLDIRRGMHTFSYFIWFHYYGCGSCEASWWWWNALKWKMHEMFMANIAEQKGSQQQIIRAKQKSSEKENPKQMRSDLSKEIQGRVKKRRAVQWKNYSDIEWCYGIYAWCGLNNVFKFYSISSVSTSTFHMQGMSFKPCNIYPLTKTPLIFRRMRSIHWHNLFWKCYCSRRLTKQFSTHLWKLKRIRMHRWMWSEWLKCLMPSSYYKIHQCNIRLSMSIDCNQPAGMIKCVITRWKIRFASNAIW